MIIELTDEDGRRGEGEVAPLEGFSVETYEEARKEIFQLKESAGQKNLSPTLRSVRFGLETAIMGLLEQKVKKPFPGYNVGKLKEAVRVNALLHADVGEDSIEDAVKAMAAGGFKTIKIKVGRNEMDDDIKKINHVVKILPRGLVIRLDANGLWDFETALKFGKNINSEFIEYIEEPCSDFHAFPDFYTGTGLPVALDESLEHIDPEAPRIPAGVKAFVLKPTILGGIGRTMGFVGLAAKHGLKPIISSCFEVGPGFDRLIKMAAAIDFDDSAHGLDTLKYLESDLLPQPLVMEKGCFFCHGQTRTDTDTT
jgi:O-succinylbenzoate synthase